MTAEIENPEKTDALTFKEKFKQKIGEFKELQGDPHYIAMGMGIGVFVAVTPTIPFHTILAVALAFVFKGSKPAAAIGVWFSNPVTIPPFYWGSYELGCLMLGHTSEIDMSDPSFHHLMEMGLDIAIATLFGGIVLGILPGIAAYFITLIMFRKIRSRKT